MTSKQFGLRSALAAAVLVVIVTLASPALAARSGNASKKGGGTGSFSLVLLDSTDGVPHWGQHVTFTVSTTASYPYVELVCYQNGTKVYSQRAGFYAGYPWTQTFTLQGALWTSGAADCTATLTSWSSSGQLLSTLATMSIHVYA